MRIEEYSDRLPAQAVRAARAALPHPAGAVEDDYEMSATRGGSTRTYSEFETYLEVLDGGVDRASYGVTTKMPGQLETLGGLRIDLVDQSARVTVYGSEAECASVFNALRDQLPARSRRPDPFAVPSRGVRVAEHAALRRLHPAVFTAAAELYQDAHYFSAVLEAFKSLEDRVRRMTGSTKSGTQLMGDAFGGSPPRVDVSSVSGQSGIDEQQGFLALFRGAILAVRNPKAHEPTRPEDPEVALEFLVFASLLHRRLDGAAGPGTSDG